MVDRVASRGMVRWAGAAGIAFVVCLVFGNVLGVNTPDYDASDQAWVAWFQDSGHRAGQIVGMFLMAAAALFLVVFFVGLLRQTLDRGASPNAIAMAGVGGTLLAGAVLVAGVVSHGVSAAVAFAPNNFPVPSADVLRSLDNLGEGVLLMAGGWSAALFVGALAHAVRDTAVAPRWLANAGYAVAVLLLASPLWFPFLLLPLWVLAVGIAMVASPTASERTAVSAPAPAT